MARHAAVLLVVCFLPAAISLAEKESSASGVFLLPADGARLEAGSRQNVRWRLGPTDEDFSPDEMELVLSVDGGLSFPVRVTPSLDLGRFAWEWRVPALATEHARLLLRTGTDERPDSEREVAVSAEFAIVCSPGLPLEELFRVGGELRTREALETNLLPGALDTGDAGKVAPPEREEAAANTRPHAVGHVESPMTTSCAPVTSSPEAPRTPDTALRASLPVPLRE